MTRLIRAIYGDYIDYITKELDGVTFVFKLYLDINGDISYEFKRAYVTNCETIEPKEFSYYRTKVQLLTTPTNVTNEMSDQKNELLLIRNKWNANYEQTTDIRTNPRLLGIICISHNVDECMLKFYANDESGCFRRISALKGSKSKHGITTKMRRYYVLLGSNDKYGHVFRYFDYGTQKELDSSDVSGTMHTNADMLFTTTLKEGVRTLDVSKARMFTTDTCKFKSEDAPKCIKDPYYVADTPF